MERKDSGSSSDCNYGDGSVCQGLMMRLRKICLGKTRATTRWCKQKHCGCNKTAMLGTIESWGRLFILQSISKTELLLGSELGHQELLDRHAWWWGSALRASSLLKTSDVLIIAYYWPTLCSGSAVQQTSWVSEWWEIRKVKFCLQQQNANITTCARICLQCKLASCGLKQSTFKCSAKRSLIWDSGGICICYNK